MASSQIIFPLRQPDSTSQPDAANLLARPVFEELLKLIQERRDELASSKHGMRLRHGAVLIDGARGTGKTSVLDNLELYLGSVDKELVNSVHVLKPIDPTLLEDHDDLFLNIVVAAILSDKAVKSALEKDSEARTAMYKELHQLGHALEHMQTQREKKGLDKVRAFIGNQDLIGHIHKFFERVLKLLDKKLLVMPIDDVDTSLHRAFENLEVVRRYLTSPLVLPVISGDAKLYHDVTWRDFHGRLLKDSKSHRMEAEKLARELAREYHRKVLPPQFRLEMPTMRSYLANHAITLGEDAGPTLTFPQFHAWLEALLNDRTNGVENSYLPVPIRTVRAFGQLVYRLRGLIPDLGQAIEAGKLTKESIRHYLLMPDLPIEAIERFRSDYQTATSTGPEESRRNSREVAYEEFARNYGANHAYKKIASPLEGVSVPTWIETLQQHFKYDHTAGAAYLVLKAQSDWTAGRNEVSEQWTSMFDTPLFQPQRQNVDYPDFRATGDLDDWRTKLKDRVPESWLSHLPGASILSYPVPEIGPMVSQSLINAYNSMHLEPDQLLLAELLLHRNFYNQSKTGVLLCVGRIFELVMTSLLRDMTANDIATILHRAPFYSFSSIAQTKTLESGEPEDEEQEETYFDHSELADAQALLADAINTWRRDVKAGDLRLSPWLVYNVMNKFFNQAWIFNDPKGATVPDPFLHMRQVAKKAFNSLWAAFGSFEKGPLYGLPPIIATVNIGDGEDFTRSDIYRQNITPFAGGNSREFGLRVGAITAMLETHPIKGMAYTVYGRSSAAVLTLEASAKPTAKRQTRSEWLYEKTGKKQFEAAARVMLTLSEQQAESILAEYLARFKDPKLGAAYRRLKGQ
ncbi:hypothetical protein IP92_03618 [Pseudoduganella flava]|uniref:ATP-binding protein n=1 Tax=Pseudoduganella flava TaxID=871742 RepID=A0A562PL89_9BURK|nr:antiviral RADAR system adenosine triphosphatase RdrA [Pseudoduganella flava]QGZ41055.1 hypothetical protein GO485_19620 [Pseudoduganella flava]TWI45242.1 hypothetical protein IP92_03618 [Pseudoduganella flava]